MNIEEIIKQAYKTMKEQRKDSPVGGCLSEQEMAGFIDNTLNKSEKQRFLTHIVSCKKCAQSLKEHYAIMQAMHKKGLLEVPGALVQKAKDLVAEEIKESVLDVVLEFKEKVIQIVNTTGDILRGPLESKLAPAYAFRTHKKEEGVKEIRVSKDIGILIVDVEVERQKPELANIVVRLTDKVSKKRATGVRVSLIKGDRELESSLTEQGKVKFEEIKLNTYKINLIKDDKQIGVINISIKATK